jgi:hypothetical protein
VAKWLSGLWPKSVQTLIGTIGRNYGGRRSRERIDARAARANVRTAPHIHHRRPNGWVDRGPNWYKHSFGQWEEVMGVCVRAARAIGVVQPSRASAEHENEREGREYRDGTGRRNRREREV